MPLIDVGWRGMEPIANPETEPCPTCGLGVTREPTVTVLRDGRTYRQTILRCPNARKYKAKAYNGSCFAKKNPCAVRKIETEIKIEMEIIDMARHANPVTRQSQEWIDNVAARRQKLGLTRHALADLAGVPHSTFGKAIAANWGASAATVEAIECALATLEAAEHATAAELLAGETDNRNAKADPYAGETAGENFIRENSEPLSDAEWVAERVGDADRLPLPGNLPTAISVPPEPLEDGSMFWPAGTEVKYCPQCQPEDIQVGFTKALEIQLGNRLAALADDQKRFWSELAEAMKRLTDLEMRNPQTLWDKEINDRLDVAELKIENLFKFNSVNDDEFDAIKKRLTAAEARLDADNSSHVDKGELSSVLARMQEHTGRLSHQTETAEYSINQLAKSVERIDHRICAVAARFDAANGSLHNRQETAEYSLNQLAKSVERIDRDEAANSERIDNLREDLTAWAGIFDMLNGAIGKHKDQIALTRVVTEAHGERLTDLENSRAEWDEDHRRIGSALDECDKSIKALEGHPSGGESPLWDALDVLTTDVKELRSSYVNRPWGARIEETVEALAAEIRILHSTAATRSWAHETGETIRALELRLSCLGKTVETRCCTRPETDQRPGQVGLSVVFDLLCSVTNNQFDGLVRSAAAYRRVADSLVTK